MYYFCKVSFKLKLNLPSCSSIALLTKDAVEIIVIVLFGVNNAVHFFLILGLKRRKTVYRVGLTVNVCARGHTETKSVSMVSIVEPLQCADYVQWTIRFS